MCVIYFADHQGCNHSHFVGTYHCSRVRCAVVAQHQFRIEDSGYECETCVTMNGKVLDPDIEPVHYYPPVEHFDIEFVKDHGVDRIVKVAPVVYQPSEGSLSDVDSETSYWKLDHTAEGKKPVFANKTPVNYEAERLWVPEVPQPAGPSPNTTLHRNLVLDQLAQLPQYMAYPQQPRQPISPSTRRNQYMSSLVSLQPPPGAFYPPPLSTVGGPTPPFYDGTPSNVQYRGHGRGFL